MKVLGVISTAALLLALGAAIPAFAQEERKEQEAKPAKQEEKAQPAKQQEAAKPAKQQEEAKPAKSEPQQQAKAPQQEEKKQQEQTKATKQQQDKQAKTQQQQHAKQQEPNKSAKQQPAKEAKQNERGNSAGQQHAQRTPAEEQKQRSEPALRLSVRSNSRIPDDRFRANFGREHYFRIGSPVMVGGYSRFQYGGFWFGFVQPWPVAWYYTDDVYVDFIDGGYYLINPYYPDARVSISVVI